MLVYILKRLGLAATVLLAALTVTFVLFFAGPTDPASGMCGRNCTADRIAEIERSLQLDRPKVQQYTDFLAGTVMGRDFSVGGIERHCPAPCLGWSFKQNRPVTDMVLERLPVTASIVLGGAIFYTAIAITLGVLAARFRGTRIDKFIVSATQGIVSIPYYILALLFFLNLMVLFPILPRAQFTPLTENPIAWAMGLLGVWIVWGMVNSTNYIRYIRASMIEAGSQDFVRTARAKGLPERTVAVKHQLRAGIAPFITLVGMGLAAEMGGAIFTEKIFGLFGMGNLALESFTNDDLPVILGVVIVSTLFVVTMNLIVDLLYGVVDPRVKLS